MLVGRREDSSRSRLSRLVRAAASLRGPSGLVLQNNHLLMLSLASRSASRVRSVAPRAIVNSSRRMLSDGIHDDFKPKVKRSYANEAGDVHAQIAEDIKANKVVVYMKGVPDQPMCGFSNAVVQVMKAEGVEFKGFNVLADPDLREGIKTFSSWPTIPQVYIDGEFIGGCDTTVEMYKSGELREMLIEKGAVAK